MKPYVTDPFDEDRSIKGLIVQLSYMEYDLYDFMYYFAFKRVLKDYLDVSEKMYGDLYMNHGFYLDTKDPYVINAVLVRERIFSALDQLELSWGLDLNELLEQHEYILESGRFKPFRLRYKAARNYKNLRLLYYRTLAAHIHYLYKMAAVFTASSYQVPRILQKQFSYPERTNLHLLNSDLPIVAMLIELIHEMLSFMELLRYQLTRPIKLKYD